MDRETLKTTAEQMMQKPKGLLAMDESSPTCAKRFSALNIPETEENRIRYRELIVTTPKLSEYISGAILFDETFHQKMSSGVLFRDYLKSIGILPGIKVDAGAKDFSNHPSEKITEGLDRLRERLVDYESQGAKFCKWRAVITIGDKIPSESCIRSNCNALARYASLCQENNLVPIVEPEVLINGDHSIEKCDEVTRETLRCLFDELKSIDIYFPGVILKPSMVISGDTNTHRADYETVADMTVNCLKELCPKDLGGIAFLSGGQTNDEATTHLKIMNSGKYELPWRVTFSYARAIQQSALNVWSGKDENHEEAQSILGERAKLCSDASIGS
ncbi:MAG: fructose-bisphosphate aldolase class I [Gammaproteobacteria bacterium]|nr:fructose-bisphosphate aldolase class I [Gammaproteobacteria bacterium]